MNEYQKQQLKRQMTVELNMCYKLAADYVLTTLKSIWDTDKSKLKPDAYTIINDMTMELYKSLKELHKQYGLISESESEDKPEIEDLEL